MSYDDGVVQDRRLIEIFNKHKIKGSFHLNSGSFSKDNKISADEIAKVYEGHEIACHSLTHPFLERISREEVINEILADRKNLEAISGYPVKGLSYPYGTYDSKLCGLLKSLGIVYSRTTESTGHFSPPDDFLRWHPTCHHREDLLEKCKKYKNGRYTFSIFYVWGHSYEFDNNKNWDLIEEFCAEIGGDPDIWYATNIEIYNYIGALHRLEFSVDRTIIRNISSIPLWLANDDETFVVQPRELLRLT
jgi:peptidoglycan/xylan/chitin deacetylase (PgdA/CDA1 family)